MWICAEGAGGAGVEEEEAALASTLDGFSS